MIAYACIGFEIKTNALKSKESLKGLETPLNRVFDRVQRKGKG